jgi:hypothetical protein
MKEVILLVSLVFFIWQLSRWVGRPVRRAPDMARTGPNPETDVLPADVPVILDT